MEKQIRGRDISAPIEYITLDGTRYKTVYSNQTARLAEDVYERQYGMDVGYAVAKDLLPELYSDTQVPRLLREKREAGELGVKTGKGLKDYTGQDIPALRRERNRKIAKSLRQIRSL